MQQKRAILLDEAEPLIRRGRKLGSKNRSKDLPVPVVNKRKKRGDYEFNSEDEASKEPMSEEDIKSLLNKFLVLPIDSDRNNGCAQNTYLQRLFKVISIIEKRENINSTQCSSNDDYIEIEFKSFKPTTLRELEKYINSCHGIGIVKKPFIPKTLEEIRERKQILEEEIAKLDRHIPMHKRCKYLLLNMKFLVMYARRSKSGCHLSKDILNRKVLRPLAPTCGVKAW